MTTANMKLVVLAVELADKLETPEQKLEAGEFIVKRVVEIAKLNEELKGSSTSFSSVISELTAIQRTTQRLDLSFCCPLLLTMAVIGTGICCGRQALQLGIWL
jgi:hypothetical protein